MEQFASQSRHFIVVDKLDDKPLTLGPIMIRMLQSLLSIAHVIIQKRDHVTTS